MATIGIDVDVSKDRLELDAALNKISEVCKEPLKDLVDYSRTVYEARRDACLGAKIASEKDLKVLEKMLKSVQVVDPSYKDTPLALQFVQKFVPAFVDPFKKLETDALPNTEFVNLAKEASKAFPVARIFAPLIPSKAPKDLNDMCKHEAFKHPNLIAFFEDIIPKHIENAKDALSEASVLKCIAILRVLKPKSVYSFQGKDSFDEIKNSLQQPYRSYFEITGVKTSEEFLKIGDVKNLTRAELEELKVRKNTTDPPFEMGTIEFDICVSNISLRHALLVDRAVWDEGIFKAWMDTGFNAVACPEFISWLEHDIERNGLKSPSGESMFMRRVLHSYLFHKNLALTTLGSEEDAWEANFQRNMMNLISKGVWLTDPGSELRTRLFNYGRTGKVEDAKLLIKSLDPSKSENFQNFDNIFQNMKYLRLLNSEVKFSSHLLHLLYNREKIHYENICQNYAFENGLLESLETLEEVFGKWTECANKDEVRSLRIFKQLSKEHLIDYRISIIEKEFSNFKDGKKQEKVKLKYAKGGSLGMFMALRAYIGMRKFKDNLDVADLETRSKAEFGFASMPQNESCLNVHTYKKNPKLHKDLSNYFLVLKYEKEWKRWDDIFDSMDERLKADDDISDKINVLRHIGWILEQCTEEGHCKIDFQSKKISCTAVSQLLSKIDEQAKYFQYMMEEGMKLDSLAKFVDFVKMEMDLYKSKLKESLTPPIHSYHDNVDSDFNAVDGPFPFLNQNV